MYIGTSIVSFHIFWYAASTAAFSGELGVYAFTGSLTALGTLKNPLGMVLDLKN
jgi:hypothetical protein